MSEPISQAELTAKIAAIGERLQPALVALVEHESERSGEPQWVVEMAAAQSFIAAVIGVTSRLLMAGVVTESYVADLIGMCVPIIKANTTPAGGIQ